MAEADEPKNTAPAHASQDATVADMMGGCVHARWDEGA
jgi:hypothetical protein